MPWNKRVTLIADDAEKGFKQRRDRIVAGFLADVVLSSPVSSGRFRGNWGVGERQQNIANNNQFDKSGGATLTNGNRNIVNTKPFTVVYVSNSIAYAEKLEKGHSPQAPDGIIRPAYRRLIARNSQ